MVRKSIRRRLAILLCSLCFSGNAIVGHAQTNVQPLCSTPLAHHMQCFALRRTDPVGGGAGPIGLHPADIQQAYRLPSQIAGQGNTVAVVDAFDDPHAEYDLAVYRQQFGLPPCTSAAGCFLKVNQRGQTTNFSTPNPDWAGEAALDMDMVSAVCPNCKILLVESDSDKDTDMLDALNTAVYLGARFVSNSYGGEEPVNAAAYDQMYFQHPGVAIAFSSGDSGYGANYPADSRGVIAVGGTSLTRNAFTPRGWSERAWSGSGSGCATYLRPLAWQPRIAGCGLRAEVDVSAVADPYPGVAGYDSYHGWQTYGGTSVSAPIIAAVYALAGIPGPSDYPGEYPYLHPTAFNDITIGSNGLCLQRILCTAGPGWDGPTGLGTPNGVAGFHA